VDGAVSDSEGHEGESWGLAHEIDKLRRQTTVEDATNDILHAPSDPVLDLIERISAIETMQAHLADQQQKTMDMVSTGFESLHMRIAQLVAVAPLTRAPTSATLNPQEEAERWLAGEMHGEMQPKRLST